jgi:hypothetical protein
MLSRSAKAVVLKLEDIHERVRVVDNWAVPEATRGNLVHV